MSIQQLATQGRDRTHGGLAAIDATRLRQMRDSGLRSCFRRLDETASRMEHVATIHGKEYINDAAAQSINATLYTLHRMAGPVVWIAKGGSPDADYSLLRSIALRKVHMIICVGPGCEALQQTFSPIVPAVVEVDSLSAAVSLASRAPIQGAKVVFSPATAGTEAPSAAAREFIHQVNEL